MSEKMIKDQQGNVICDLQSPGNGGSDLYEEYNNGVDRIVSSFGVCAERQREVEQAQKSKEQALAQNDQDREEDLLGLTREQRNIENRIQTAKLEADQKREDRKARFEAQIRTLAAERADRLDQLGQARRDQERTARAGFMAAAAEKERKDQSVMESYEVAIDNVNTALGRLESGCRQCADGIRDAKGRISSLESTRETILSDEQIHDSVTRYATDGTKYQAALSRYYQEKRRPGALEREQQLKLQTKAREEGQEQEISRRIQERLQGEGITSLLATEAGLPSDGKELERRAKFEARNEILGPFRSRSGSGQGRTKYWAMLLFCYPVELLVKGVGSYAVDCAALVPAIVFMAAAYLRKPSMALCMAGWFAALALYHIASWFRLLPAAYRVDYTARTPAKVASLLYPVYIYLLTRKVKVCVFWLLLCALLYFMQDAIFGIKMCFAKYKQQYNDAYERSKGIWNDRIRLVQEAKERKKVCAWEEEERVKAELRRQQQELEQLARENQQEQEELRQEFQAHGWQQQVDAWKEQLLQRREDLRQWNQGLDGQIASIEEEAGNTAGLLARLQERYSEIQTKWAPWLADRQAQLHQAYQEQYERFEAQHLHGNNSYDNAQNTSFLPPLPEPAQRQLNRIDWLQTELSEFPGRLEQAAEELDRLGAGMQGVLAGKEQEYQQSCREADRTYEKQSREAEAEYERKREDAEEGFSTDLREITRKCEKQTGRLEAEAGHIESEMTETVRRCREKAQKIAAEWDEEIARRRVKYREEMDSRLSQLKENGMLEVCGFNYRQAWIRFHALATNTLCFPVDGYSVRNGMLTGLTAKAADVNHECCELMPRHLMWGASPVHSRELTPEILGEIGAALRECPEFNTFICDREDIDSYHYERVPGDTFYKLDCVPMEDGPAMLVYDMGNLEGDSRKRNLLMDFVLRTFVFGFRQCVGNGSHINFQIISTQHEEYLKNYDRKGWVSDDHYHVYADPSGAGKMIRELQRGREELGLGNAATLYKRNCERSRDGRNPADSYEILIIVNTDYKELQDVGLVSLLEASHRIGMGMYSYLLVDLNFLKRMEDSSRERSIESIQKFADAIEADSRFYEISAVQEGFQIKAAGKAAVVSAVVECGAEG